MRDFLVIHVNGLRHEICGQRAFQTLSNFLRYDLGLIGTKVVCAEGDCGSCSVLIGRATADKTIDYQAITSCIQFLYQLDAAHVITVEGLRDDGKLNVIQEAMARCHGAQCGFCTPGFVVAMCAHADAVDQVTDASLRAALTGNLCRCTGYEAILKAGVEASRSRLSGPSELYPQPTLLAELRQRATESVLITAGERKFFKPITTTQAVQFRAENPTAIPIAGATDVGVQVNKQIRDPFIVLSLGSIAELRSIDQHNGVISVGGLATLSDLHRATEQSFPDFANMLARHGSPLIRNAGTLAGNIANGSPIGDTMPALYVLNGEIELTSVRGSRRVNINDFYTGYRTMVMTPDELITRAFIPLPHDGEVFKLYKVSKRHDLDISTFTAAFWMQRSNGVFGDIRIAYGGCGPNIIRMKKTEAALIGKPFSEAEIESATEIARAEITPISDVRGSADYRFLLAENILRKFFADATGIQTYQRVTAAPLAVSQNGNGNPH